jgi:phosphatidylcholine synthase
MAIDAAKPGSIRSRAFPARSKAAAALVHAYTASGAVLAFLGIDAVYRSDVRFAFAMMLLATVVDATDGALARRARVKEVLPAIDGAHLDDIVDYLTFVLLPMLLAHHEGLFPAALSPWIVSAVLLSSAYGFTAADAKTSDYFFTGFPSYWNIAVLYLIALRSPAAVNAAVVAALVALVFVRIGYVYPSRTPVLKRLTLALAWLWGIALGVIVWMLPAPPRPLAIVSLAFPVYYTVLSLVLHARRPAAVIRT